MAFILQEILWSSDRFSNLESRGPGSIPREATSTLSTRKVRMTWCNIVNIDPTYLDFKLTNES